MFNVDLFQSNLKTKIIGRKTFYYASTISTNDDIWKIFKKEKNEGIVVIANEQMKGKGRGNKNWFSKKNKSIICSFLIKEKFLQKKLNLHSILIPVGVILGIKKTINKIFSIKWPNDIVLKNKKICGILIETKKYNNITYLNIGLGINVNESDTDFPTEIKTKAISIKTIFNNEVQRELLLANILNSIDKLLITKDEKNIIDSWIKYCEHINKTIKIQYKETIIKAKFKTINYKGQAIFNYNNKDIVLNGTILNI